ncbi:DUF1330 domain-containing protein [Luteibacter sp. ME-Dv--P-043b]|uniref:DUF1330 domain-containing protein n=1 Tax=Luteibacter sp. ME-Dv--P-043b TaxID=3040291 RepID=UPI002557BD4C|nr:DUF1330 domain-containing protein [Luteibacter sp. ME-Dv--P-043b]
MTTYVVFTRDRIKDEKEFATYGQLAAKAGEGHPATRLAFYGEVETLEGDPVDGSVIISFPTKAEALAWYNSPAYTAAREHRFKGADYRVYMVEGV